MDLTLGQMVFIAFMLPGLFVIVWAIRTNKRLIDKFNLFFRKHRVVKVNLVTHSGRNLEKFTIPDERGILHVNGGVYWFHREGALINGLNSIPEVTVLENQIQPVTPKLLLTNEGEEVEFDSPLEGGGTEKKKVRLPSVLVSYKNMIPKTLDGHVSKEIQTALSSKIVDDIVRASSKEMAKLELMFFIMLGLVGICLIGFLVMYNQMKDLKTQLEIIKTVVGGVHLASQ